MPLIVEYDAFWTRYFYRLHKLEQKHQQFLQLAQRAQQPEEEVRHAKGKGPQKRFVCFWLLLRIPIPGRLTALPACRLDGALRRRQSRASLHVLLLLAEVGWQEHLLPHSLHHCKTKRKRRTKWRNRRLQRPRPPLQ